MHYKVLYLGVQDRYSAQARWAGVLARPLGASALSYNCHVPGTVTTTWV